MTGKYGKGKSKIFQIILGFSPYNSGELYIDNRIVTDHHFSEIRKQFAYVNQDVTLRPGIVTDVLKEISSFSGNTYNNVFDQNLADLFEFDNSLLQKNTIDLSGGERQRLGIIISIMLNRRAFLLDEVTSALDNNLKQKVVNYFSKCNHTVVSVSHDSNWAESNVFKKVVW